MSHILRDPDQIITYPPMSVGRKVPCLVCGDPADAEWNGSKGDITVCLECAVSVLPKLIADAIGSHYIDGAAGLSPFTGYESDLLRHYWKGVSALMLHWVLHPSSET